MKKLSLFLLTGLLSLSVLSGCQQSSTTDTSESSTETSSSVMEEESSNTTENTQAVNKNAIGSFSTIDMYENPYTDAIFADYELTLVNVCATWCGPCVKELPYLETVYQDMKDEGVNVIAFVLDTALASGKPWKPYMLTGQNLIEKTGITFPFLVPDPTFLGGRLKEINSVPTTFFVDSEGNIVGSTYVGSRSAEQWKIVIKNELKNLRGE